MSAFWSNKSEMPRKLWEDQLYRHFPEYDTQNTIPDPNRLNNFHRWGCTTRNWKLTKKSNNHLFRLKGRFLLWVFLFCVPSWCLPDALQWSSPFYVYLFLSFFDTPMIVWAWPWELCVWKIKALTDLISLLTFFLSSFTIRLWLLHRTENSCVVPWCYISSHNFVSQEKKKKGLKNIIKTLHSL